MAVYKGVREEPLKCVVTVDGKPLSLRLDLWNHSPAEFEWGYGGSGPAQLALAILAHHLENDQEAVSLHQNFKRIVISQLPHDKWVLTSQDVNKALEIIKGS